MILKFIISFFIICKSICFAQESDFFENQFFLKLLENESDYIKFISGTHCYLQEKHLVPTDRGLLLILDDDNFIFIPKLMSDEAGCYIELASDNSFLFQNDISRGNVQIFNNCPGCGQQYFIRCKNPDCPIYQKRNKKGNSS